MQLYSMKHMLNSFLLRSHNSDKPGEVSRCEVGMKPERQPTREEEPRTASKTINRKTSMVGAVKNKK